MFEFNTYETNDLLFDNGFIERYDFKEVNKFCSRFAKNLIQKKYKAIEEITNSLNSAIRSDLFSMSAKTKEKIDKEIIFIFLCQILNNIHYLTSRSRFLPVSDLLIYKNSEPSIINYKNKKILEFNKKNALDNMQKENKAELSNDINQRNSESQISEGFKSIPFINNRIYSIDYKECIHDYQIYYLRFLSFYNSNATSLTTSLREYTLEGTKKSFKNTILSFINRYTQLLNYANSYIKNHFNSMDSKDFYLFIYQFYRETLFPDMMHLSKSKTHNTSYYNIFSLNPIFHYSTGTYKPRKKIEASEGSTTEAKNPIPIIEGHHQIVFHYAYYIKLILSFRFSPTLCSEIIREKLELSDELLTHLRDIQEIIDYCSYKIAKRLINSKDESSSELIVDIFNQSFSKAQKKRLLKSFKSVSEDGTKQLLTYNYCNIIVYVLCTMYEDSQIPFIKRHRIKNTPSLVKMPKVELIYPDGKGRFTK